MRKFWLYAKKTSFACEFTSIERKKQYLIFGKWATLRVVRCAHYATLRNNWQVFIGRKIIMRLKIAILRRKSKNFVKYKPCVTARGTLYRGFARNNVLSECELQARLQQYGQFYGHNAKYQLYFNLLSLVKDLRFLPIFNLGILYSELKDLLTLEHFC